MNGTPTNITKTYLQTVGPRHGLGRHISVDGEYQDNERSNPLKSDWLFAQAQDPWEPGYYEVRNSRRFNPRAKACLHGQRIRYWDGKLWWPDKPGTGWSAGKNPTPSTFGPHETHQWRGLNQKLPEFKFPHYTVFGTRRKAQPNFYFVAPWGLHHGQ